MSNQRRIGHNCSRIKQNQHTHGGYSRRGTTKQTHTQTTMSRMVRNRYYDQEERANSKHFSPSTQRQPPRSDLVKTRQSLTRWYWALLKETKESGIASRPKLFLPSWTLYPKMKRQSDTAPQAETVMPNVIVMPEGPDGLGLKPSSSHFCRQLPNVLFGDHFLLRKKTLLEV